MRQNLRCLYPPQPRLQHTTLALHDDSESDNLSTVIDTGNVGATPFLFDLEPLDELPCTGTQFLELDLPTGTNSLDSLTSVMDFDIIGEDELALTKSHHHHSSSSSFFSTTITPFAKKRIEYSIEQLKLAPRTMVDENATIWCHPMLYEECMPRELQDAHASCALFHAWNETNADFVTRHIGARARELTDTLLPETSIEILARAHALILYQIMLVFGGDIQLYSQAEALLPHLDTIGNRLLILQTEQTDPSGPLPLYPSSAVRAAWTSFILRESLRRTILSLFQLITLCGLLRGQNNTCAHDLVQGNKVTMSAHLWNAKTAFDFGVAWNEKEHFLVRELDFTRVLSDAKPDDLDTFARTILVGIKGLDDMKGWFHMRGAAF
jgi:hypothetical protein